MDSRLHAFLATVRQGHVTGAARQLNMSVSAVSHHIAQLEQDFAAQLFIRGNRGMALTPAGETLYHYAIQIEGAWGQAYREVSAKVAGDQVIRLAASHTVTEFFLPQPLGIFRKQHPDVRLHLQMVNSDDVLSLVESGEVDLGISEGRGGHRSLKSVGLWMDELGCVLAEDHRLAHCDSVSLKEVLSEDLILREEGSGTRSIFEWMLTERGVSPRDVKVTAELASIQGILGMVAHGVGVSILSRVVTFEVPDILFVPIRDLSLKRQIALVERHGKVGNAAIGQLIETIIRSADRFNQRRLST